MSFFKHFQLKKLMNTALLALATLKKENLSVNTIKVLCSKHRNFLSNA
jgi:hypothetical protein